MKALSQKDRLAWLRLIRSENVGPITFYHLLARFGSAQAALEAVPELAAKGGRKKIKLCSQGAAEKEYAAAEGAGAQLIARDDPLYPPLLRQIDDAPPILTVKGHPQLLTKKAIALVGARNASVSGCKIAGQFAHDLGQGGLAVVSGLARGIDGAAHAASLETGTIGVQGGGVDVVYPRENAALYDQMAERGCIIAESPMGTQPQSRHFPRRNRIISGLCRAVVVVEAAPRSGSLITARMALEQGRDVFAVPGSPLDLRAKGTNDLIREGAILADSAASILMDMSAHAPMQMQEEPIAFQNPIQPAAPLEVSQTVRETIIAALSPTPVGLDDVVRQCHVSVHEVQNILLELELAGRLDRHSGNMVALIQ